MILIVFVAKGGWQVIGYIIVFMIFDECPFYLLGVFGAMVTAMVGIIIYGLVYLIKRRILEKRGKRVPIKIEMAEMGKDKMRQEIIEMVVESVNIRFA